MAEENTRRRSLRRRRHRVIRAFSGIGGGQPLNSLKQLVEQTEQAMRRAAWKSWPKKPMPVGPTGLLVFRRGVGPFCLTIETRRVSIMRRLSDFNLPE